MLHVHQRGKSERQQPRDVSRNEEMLRKSRSKIGNSYSVDVNQLPKNVFTKARQLFGSEICQHYLQERGFKRNLKVDKESVCLWEEENGNLFSEKYQPVSLSCKEKSEESGVVDLPDHQQTQKHSPPLSEDVTLVVPSETGQDSLLAARGLDILVDESSSETKSLYNALETELWSPKLAKIFSPEAGVEQSRYQIEGIRSNNLQTSHNITSVDVSEHWNTSSHCDNSQNPDNITTSNVDVSKHWNTSSHCDNSQNPDNITTSNVNVSKHWNTSSHGDNSQNPDNITSNVDVPEHWNTSSRGDNSQNPDNITTSNVDVSEHWNTSSHGDNSQNPDNITVGVDVSERCSNSQNPDNITTSNVDVFEHWNTSSHCDNSQNPDNITVGVDVSERCSNSQNPDNITTSNVDVSEHWNTSSRGDNSQNPDNITSNVDVSEHWNTSSHGDTSQNPDNKTSNVDVSEHWDKSSDTQEDVNVVALSSCFKSVVKDDIHCKETCHDDPPLDHSFNTTDSFRFISLTETERVGQSNNSSKEDQVETFKHRDGASSSDEFKTSSFEERIPLSTGSTSNEEGKQTSEHQVCSDVISLENKMSTITQDVSRKQTQDNEENDDENKEDDNESLNTLKLEEDNCKVTEDVLQNSIVKSLDSGIRKRKCSKRQVNNVNNMSENQDIQCEIPIKNRKVSALSVYASIENGMITEVKCKRFKKRTVKNREKCDISGTSDCRTAGEEREGNIAKNKNSCLVVSPKPTNYSCDPAIREVVEDLVQTVFLNSLDRENDLKLEDPNNVRVKDLFQKFCDDFNFEHCDYQELITDFSETVKPKLSGCGEYSVPPTKRGRKKFDPNINSSAPDVPQHLYHRGESKTMNKFYHSISLRRKSRWLRQIPSAKRVVTRLALHEMGLEKVEDLESIHEGKKRKSSGGVVEDASRASATFVKFNGGVVEDASRPSATFVKFNGGVVEDASRPSATFVKFNGGVVEDASRASATFAKFNGLRKDKTASSQKKQSLKRKRRIMNQSGNDGSCFTSCQVHEECVKEGGHDSVRLTSVQNGYKVNYKNLKRTNLEDGVRIVGKPQDTLVPRNYGFRERSHRDLKENEQNAGTDSLGKKTKKFRY
ncbi:uncharacterized protein LOC106470405 [Limulus polyphemus]|uniref:Uncharacterized protein LOC106470405 n=1 Tax=Limulus polyphemus TaxID=6850 RepID=A0ABM1BPZ0_LIMPO|nr:uncharacterized protein LOC106470405 [Limulus polyphemus]